MLLMILEIKNIIRLLFIYFNYMFMIMKKRI